jgi:leucyl-tRNA synthetase
MILSNHLGEFKEIPKVAYGTFVKLLAPFAPHITSEIASIAGYPDGALNSWPTFDAQKASVSMVTIAVQINGRARFNLLEIPVNMPEVEALALARANPTVATWLAKGKEIRAIYVPGRIINFVLE